jgi:hypothetical protein
MSARGVERALERLAAPFAVLARDRLGASSYGVHPNGDKRRRPVAKLSEADVRSLLASGAIVSAGEDVFVLSEAGRARVRRESAVRGEAFVAQHSKVVDRDVIDDNGRMHKMRGFDPALVMKRIAALRDARGAPWLSGPELHVAGRLRADWDAAQAGMLRGSDWAAPPRSGSARGPGNAQEAALAARCDAGRRMNEALDTLAPPLRRVVERVVLHEEGLEAIERAERWPSRSGKIALKLGLAQLAQRF